MPIGGPANLIPPVLHDCQSVCVCQRQGLIGEFPDQFGGFDQFGAVERKHFHRQDCDEVEELDGANGIVAPQKPAVAFRDDQRRGRERRRIREEAPEEWMESIGAVAKRDQRRRIYVGFSLSRHKLFRRWFGWNSDRRIPRRRRSASRAPHSWREAYRGPPCERNERPICPELWPLSSPVGTPLFRG